MWKLCTISHFETRGMCARGKEAGLNFMDIYRLDLGNNSENSRGLWVHQEKASGTNGFRPTLEEEFGRRNPALDAVAAYCHFQEWVAVTRLRARPSTQRVSPTLSIETNPQLAAAKAEKQALSDAMLLVFTEKRTTICFLCLGEESLPFKRRTKKFASPGDLTKHVKRKHLSHIKEGDRLECKACQMGLQHKQHLQNHALSIYRAVS
jgi:hypothetical protein